MPIVKYYTAQVCLPQGIAVPQIVLRLSDVQSIKATAQITKSPSYSTQIMLYFVLWKAPVLLKGFLLVGE